MTELVGLVLLLVAVPAGGVLWLVHTQAVALREGVGTGPHGGTIFWRTGVRLRTFRYFLVGVAHHLSPRKPHVAGHADDEHPWPRVGDLKEWSPGWWSRCTKVEFKYGGWRTNWTHVAASGASATFERVRVP